MKRARYLVGTAVVTLLAALIAPAASAAPATHPGKREPIPGGLCSVTNFVLDIGGTGLSETDSDVGLPVTAPSKSVITCVDFAGTTTETGLVTASDITLYGTCAKAFATGSVTISWTSPAGADNGTSSGRGTLVLEQSDVANAWDLTSGDARIDLSSREFGGTILTLPGKATHALQSTGTATEGICKTGLKEVTLTIGQGETMVH